MRVHAAIWYYAGVHGSVYAQAYVRKRASLQGEDLVAADNAWFRGRGGINLRKSWMALPELERLALLNTIKDSSYPTAMWGTDGEWGITDERRTTPPSQLTKSSRKKKRCAESSSVSDSTAGLAECLGSLPKADKTDRNAVMKCLRVVRSRYFEKCLLKMSCCLLDEEAYEATAKRLVDVLVSMGGMTIFQPEIHEAGDEPSEDFAQIRVQNLFDDYEDAVDAASNDMSGVPVTSIDRFYHSRTDFSETRLVHALDQRNTYPQDLGEWFYQIENFQQNCM
ncbi:unnamed protein product [Phytophthora fragariaefolia]|uniref:Unnamed protein product n=1 Tax=Phytophthora fragariaefolia TaxID=1490495 RepID=A0A9W7CS61_9STRA|nr:unnamed protein product [Phytophthora fragariaefolia]